MNRMKVCFLVFTIVLSLSLFSSLVRALDVTAASGYPGDIQAAVDQVVAAGGGTVYIPEGTWTFEPRDSGLTGPYTRPVGVQFEVPAGGINIFGAGKDATILQMPIDDSAPNVGMFSIKGGYETSRSVGGWVSGGKLRISGITFKGRPNIDTSPSGDHAILLVSSKDFRIDNCDFYYMGSVGVWVQDQDTQYSIVGGDPDRITQGVIDHCDFIDMHKSAALAAGRGYGYGVGIGRAMNWEWTYWEDDPWTLFGKYDGNIFIEDCYFTRCRHAVAASSGGAYVLRNSIIEDIAIFSAATTGHPNRNDYFGMLAQEIYNVEIRRTPAGAIANPNNFFGVLVEGGSALLYNNTFDSCYRAFDLSTCEVTGTRGGTHPRGHTKEVYIWDNTYINLVTTFNIFAQDCPAPVEGVEYFLNAPPSEKNYQPYPYPHPLTIEEVPATSGSPDDIQAAVDQAIEEAINTGEMGVVIIPEGTWTFEPYGTGRFDDRGRHAGVKFIVPDEGLWIKGAGLNGTGHPKTILQMPAWPEAEGGPDMTSMFFIVGGYDDGPRQLGSWHFGGKVRISEITFIGRPEDGVSTQSDDAIWLESCKDFRVDHCDFYWMGGNGVDIHDHWTQIDRAENGETGDPGRVSQGLVDHCNFYDIYKHPINTNGYGVGMGRAMYWAKEPWEENIWKVMGTAASGQGAVYIEDCYFKGCRHAVTGGNAIVYCLRNSVIEDIRNDGGGSATTGHPNRAGIYGMRAHEIYNTTIKYTGQPQPGPVPGGFRAIHIEGGGGLVYNNTIEGHSSDNLVYAVHVQNGECANDYHSPEWDVSRGGTCTYDCSGQTACAFDEWTATHPCPQCSHPRAHPKDIYVWDNQVSYVDAKYVAEGGACQGGAPPQEGVEYFTDDHYDVPNLVAANSQAAGYPYEPFVYPHPLTLGETPTTTTTTTTIPLGQILISGQLMNDTGTIEADVIAYNQDTSQINISDSTDSGGSYSLLVWPGTYDLQYNIIYIPNFFIKIMSLNVLSNLQNAVNYVNKLSNGISFRVNIIEDQVIQIYSPDEPKNVTANGEIMTRVYSMPSLANEWYYDGQRLYMIASPVLPTTTTTLTTTTTTSTTTIPGTTTTIPSGYIFADGFESGHIVEPDGAWTSTDSYPGTSLDVTSNEAYTGGRSLNTTYTTGEQTWWHNHVDKNFGTNYEDVYARLYFNTKYLPPDGKRLHLMSFFGNGSTDDLQFLSLINSSGAYQLSLFYWDGGGLYDATYNIPSISKNIWYPVEMRRKATNPGIASVWWDGSLVIDVTGNFFDAAHGWINSIHVGMDSRRNDVTDWIQSTLFDDVVVSNIYIGP